MIALAAGGDLPAHRAPGPLTLTGLEGEVVFVALDREYTLKAGDILVLAPGVEHAARSTGGGVFLLTLVHPAPASHKITNR